MEIINDFSFLAPYMIKSVILFLVIGLSSIVVNKTSFSVPEDDEYGGHTMSPEVASAIWEASVILVIVIIAGLSFYGEYKEKKANKK